MKRINDFAWADEHGGLHVDIPAMLRIMGVADTPANRAEATRLAEKVMREKVPTAEVVHVP